MGLSHIQNSLLRVVGNHQSCDLLTRHCKASDDLRRHDPIRLTGPFQKRREVISFVFSLTLGLETVLAISAREERAF